MIASAASENHFYIIVLVKFLNTMVASNKNINNLGIAKRDDFMYNRQCAHVE